MNTKKSYIGVVILAKISPEQLNEMLKMASKHLGTDPETLKSKLQSENVGDVVKNMKNSEASKIQKFLKNPKLAQQLLNSPQAQELIKKLKN